MNTRTPFVLLARVATLNSPSITLQVRQSASAARLLAGSIPQHIAYQGRLTDAAGLPLNGSHIVQHSLFLSPGHKGGY